MSSASGQAAWPIRFIKWLGNLGTKDYPRRIARRLRVVNIVTWLAATMATTYIPYYAIYDYSGLAPAIWAIAIQCGLFYLTPWFHRFGDGAAATVQQP